MSEQYNDNKGPVVHASPSTHFDELEVINPKDIPQTQRHDSPEMRAQIDRVTNDTEITTEKKTSRRGFLKMLGVGAAAAAVGGTIVGGVVYANRPKQEDGPTPTEPSASAPQTPGETPSNPNTSAAPSGDKLVAAYREMPIESFNKLPVKND